MLAFFAHDGVLWAALIALAACTRVSHTSSREPMQPTLTIASLASGKVAKRGSESRTPARSHLIATVARAAIGPLSARSREGGIAAWIAPAQRGMGAELVVVLFDADGAPLGEPRVVEHVSREATSLVLKPTERARGGWLLAWSALLDRGESLSLLELGHDGSALGEIVELRRTDDHIAWADLLLTTEGALCVWAEEPSRGDANLLVAPIGSDGKPRGMPARVASGIERWAAARSNDGAALALVTRDKSSSAGLLSWLRLDDNGRPQGVLTPIGKAPTVSGDVDLVPAPDGWLLAWTDRTGEDPQVVLATVDRAGRVRGPHHAMDAVGGSSLVDIASGDAGIAMAWESPHRGGRSHRALHLASVSTSDEPVAQPVTSVDVVARATTELVAGAQGFALLTSPVSPCVVPRGAGGDSCPAVPTFVRYDAHLSPAQVEPLLVGKEPVPATLAWGLRCAKNRCIALAATSDPQTPVFTVDLEQRESPYDLPDHPSSFNQGTRPTALVTLESGQPFADLAVARAGDTTLVATIANPLDAAAEGQRARRGTVSVRPFDDAGRPLGAAVILSSSAVLVGRIAIAQGRPSQKEAAVAWISRDDAESQVQVIRVDARGRRTAEARLRKAKGDASDVALAWVGDGWLVAWVDRRDGNGEVYVTKIDSALHRVSSEERITHAPGDAAELAMAWGDAGSQDLVWLAWSDAREAPGEGLGDVYVITIRTRDAKPAGEEVRVLATAAHSRSPQLAACGPHARLAWIEDAPPGVDAPGAAMIAELDAHSHLVGAPVVAGESEEGRPTAIALAAGPRVESTRTVVARAAHDVITLDAMAGSSTSSVLELEASAPFDVPLALYGGALFYIDTGVTPRDRRVRRLTLSWRQPEQAAP